MGTNIQEVFSKLLWSKTKSFGLPPGTLTEANTNPNAVISVMKYNSFNYSKHELPDLDLLKHEVPNINPNSVMWLDLDTVHDTTAVKKLGEIFNIHPLVLEDISNVHQRPKLEDMDDYIYLVVSMIYLDHHTKEIIKEQISFILGEGLLISFQEKPGDVFNIVRKRLETAKGRLRKMSADYLLYSLLDVILDNYFIVLNYINEQVNKLSIGIDKVQSNEKISEVQNLKQKLLNITRYITPIKEVTWNLLKIESDLIHESTEFYFKDLNDHILQIDDSVDVLRDSLTGLLQYANSIISNKLNEIMKVLTVVSTIFIPLNFIASIYGMNFAEMPELNYQYGYFVIMSIMTTLGVGMLTFFKVKKWI